MLIENPQSEPKTFNDVNIGGSFLCENDVYIRMSSVLGHEKLCNVTYNAVRLSDGEAVSLCGSKYVYNINEYSVRRK